MRLRGLLTPISTMQIRVYLLVFWPHRAWSVLLSMQLVELEGLDDELRYVHGFFGCHHSMSAMFAGSFRRDSLVYCKTVTEESGKTLS